MTIGPKPRISRNAPTVNGALLGVGVILLLAASVLGPRAFFEGTSVPEPSSQISNGAPFASRLTLSQKKTPYGFFILFAVGLGTTFSTIALYDLAKFGVEYLDYHWSGGADFDNFFGDDASSRPGDGVIHLRPANIKDKHFAEGSGSNAAGKPESREAAEAGEPNKAAATGKPWTYKARHWVNRWDMEGTISIRKMFRDLGLDAPGFEPVVVGKEGKRQPGKESPPFVIEMGLGFFDLPGSVASDGEKSVASDREKNVASDFGSWMKIEKGNILYGDCLHVAWKFLPPTMMNLQPSEIIQKAYRIDGQDVQIPPDDDGLVPILPKDWNYEQWAGEDTTQHSYDYAIILRRTYLLGEGGSRQVHFVVAGFTERSTAIAAAYLAARWTFLYEEYVRGKHASKGKRYGDFLLVIAGKSDVDAAQKWVLRSIPEWKEGFHIKADELPKWENREDMLPPVIV